MPNDKNHKDDKKKGKVTDKDRKDMLGSGGADNAAGAMIDRQRERQMLRKKLNQ